METHYQMTPLLRMGVSKDIISISSFISIKGLRVINLVHTTRIHFVIYSRNFEIHPLLRLDTVVGTGNVKINNPQSPPSEVYNRVEEINSKQKFISFYRHSKNTIKFEQYFVQMRECLVLSG